MLDSNLNDDFRYGEVKHQVSKNVVITSFRGLKPLLKKI